MKKVDFKEIIVFEDEDYICINKPPFIATLEDRNDPVNINKIAKEYHQEAHACHRLDKETSGILALAKSTEAYRNLAIQFEKRKVQKMYHAVVAGKHDYDGVSVYLPIETKPGATSVRINKQEGKEAETIFFTEKAYKNHTLLRCYPLTGRMHQIRIHLACLKTPIVCDATYGGLPVFLSQLKKRYNLPQDQEEELPIMKRVALHAVSLTFTNMKGETITATAPYPKDFNVLIKQLEKHT
ncbi:MAG: RNA pseudouridine synthase [Cytophagales bacterium]|nr:MAG: RNA pseudouridine synthase [Cytophagales bacterium]